MIWVYPPASPPAIIEHIPHSQFTFITTPGQPATVVWDGGDSGEGDSGDAGDSDGD